MIDLPLSYTGFEIDYTRVIGYGMDYKRHRILNTLQSYKIYILFLDKKFARIRASKSFSEPNLF